MRASKCTMSHVIAQSVFKPQEDVAKAACEQYVMLQLPQEIYPMFTVCSLSTV